MVSKLIKFEARSTFRLLVIVWAALLAMSIIIGTVAMITGVSAFQDSMHGSTALYVIDKIINVLMWTLYVALFVAQIVLTTAIVVMRFYKGLLGDEGYLMHTLPVSTGSLIASKGIIASVAILGSVIAGTLSILIIAFSFEPTELLGGFRELGFAISRDPIIILYIFEGLILSVLSAVAAVYHIYASLSIGQLVNRHRIITSLGVYIGIGMAFSFIGTVLGIVFALTGLDEIISNAFLQGYLGPQMIFIGAIIMTAIPIVVFHLVCERLLSRNLNLL